MAGAGLRRLMQGSTGAAPAQVAQFPCRLLEAATSSHLKATFLASGPVFQAISAAHLAAQSQEVIVPAPAGGSTP